MTDMNVSASSDENLVMVWDVLRDCAKFLPAKYVRENLWKLSFHEHLLVDPQFLGFTFTLDNLRTHARVDIGDELYQNYNNSLLEDVDLFFAYYVLCLEYVIRSSNVYTMMCMWDSLYYNDRNCPDFNWNMELALKHGNLATVAMSWYGLLFYNTLNGTQTISVNDAKIWASENKKHQSGILKLIDQYVELLAQVETMKQPVQMINEFDFKDVAVSDEAACESVLDMCRVLLSSTLIANNCFIDKVKVDLKEHRDKHAGEVQALM